MHPWKTKVVPDVGQFMYNHVHSLHHKSYITAPWSGLAMHPVEHLFYYSCTLLTMVSNPNPRNPKALLLCSLLPRGMVEECVCFSKGCS
jgi:hypothetical protein